MTLLIISILIMLVGLAGVLLPFLPGVPLAWVGFFIYDYGTNFEVLPHYASLIFFILMVLSVIMEFALPILGAKKYQASKKGLVGAALGLLIGPFVFNIVGVIIGPLIGAIIGELLAGKQQQAFRSGLGTFIGFMISMISRMVLVLVMVGVFAVAVIFK